MKLIQGSVLAGLFMLSLNVPQSAMAHGGGGFGLLTSFDLLFSSTVTEAVTRSAEIQKLKVESERFFTTQESTPFLDQALTQFQAKFPQNNAQNLSYEEQVGQFYDWLAGLEN
jgi:hypothetical protein